MTTSGGHRFSLMGLILNLLTTIILLATLVIGAGFAAVFVNPEFVGVINPYLPIKLSPAPTLPPTLGPPTATQTPANYLPVAWTPTPTETEIPTETPTETPAPTDTPTATPMTPQPSPTGWAFILQAENPKLTQNFANTKGCQWMGLAGQAFDKQSNAPITGLAVHLAGTIGSTPFDLTSLTGSAPAYGPGGYEFVLGNKPVASNQTLSVQLMDTSGVALSDKVYVTTSDQCSQNLVLVHWIQVR